MKEVITQILKVIPDYLINFFKIIASPREFTLNKLPKNESEITERLKESLVFILISYLLIVLLTASQDDTENFYKNVGSEAISILITISIYAFAIFIAWRIVGGRQKFLNYFIIYSYQSGIVLIIIVLFEIMSDGYFKVFDIELYKNLLDDKFVIDKKLFENSTFVLGLIIYFLGYVIVTIWGLILWGAYRIMNNLTKLKSFGAFLITIILSWIALWFKMLIINGLPN